MGWFTGKATDACYWQLMGGLYNHNVSIKHGEMMGLYKPSHMTDLCLQIGIIVFYYCIL